MRATIAAAGMLLTTLAVPAPGMADGNQCVATTLNPECEFHCHAFDQNISVVVTGPAGTYVGGSAECDGALASCEGLNGFCFHNAGPVLTSATGRCKLGQGTTAACQNYGY